MRAYSRTALVVVFLVALAVQAFALPLYNITDLGSFAVTPDLSIGFGVNATGEVTGFSVTPMGYENAFLYNGTTLG